MTILSAPPGHGDVIGAPAASPGREPRHDVDEPLQAEWLHDDVVDIHVGSTITTTIVGT
jgi:hypothetical protein